MTIDDHAAARGWITGRSRDQSGEGARRGYSLFVPVSQLPGAYQPAAVPERGRTEMTRSAIDVRPAHGDRQRV